MISLFSCSPKFIPIKGVYQIRTEFESTKPLQEVWDNALDLMAKNGYETKILSKENGLIWFKEVSFISSRTREDDSGKIIDTTARVVVSRIYVKGADTPEVVPVIVNAEWNIRVKVLNGKTVIAVNMVNLYANSRVNGERKLIPIDAKSTGVFEKYIFDQINH